MGRVQSLAVFPKLQWRTVNTPTQQPLRILRSQSLHDFWVYEQKAAGAIFHFRDSTWRQIAGPVFSEKLVPYTRVIYRLEGEKSFLGIVVDSEYRTHFYRFSDRNWEKMDITAEAPVRQLVKLSEHEFLIGGDWGLLFRYKSERLYPIRNPIQNHITAMAVDRDRTLWLGVRNESIYSYDGREFQKFGYSDSLHFDIIHIDTDRGRTVRFFTSGGDCFQLNKGLFQQQSNSLPQSDRWLYTSRQDGRILAYSVDYPGEVYISLKQEWQRYELPVNFKVLDATLFSDYSGLLSGRSGELLIGVPRRGTFFRENAGRYQLDGSIYDQSTGGALIDLNEDELLDIFVLNTGVKQYNRFYLNKGNRRFVDYSDQCGPLNTYRCNLFHFGDINCDGRLDAVIYESAERSHILLCGKRMNSISLRPLTLGEFSDIRDIKLVDYDADGDLDICFTSYYRSGRNMGANLLLENRFFGMAFRKDTSFIRASRGWNVQTTFSDFNMDNIPEAYISNYWNPDKRLFYRDNRWYAESGQRSSDLDNMEQSSDNMISTDFDLDGDLDLLVYGKWGACLHIRDQIGDLLQIEDSIWADIPAVHFLFVTVADYNNDGYPDLFTSSPTTERNYLFLNDSARNFIDVAKDYGVREPFVRGAIAGDIDNDGDIDIFGLREGVNQLWENQTDDSNYLKVIACDTRRPFSGMLTKVWVYAGGHYGDTRFLKGFREIGSDSPGSRLYNSPVAHFGLEAGRRYDIKVTYLGGKTRSLTGVRSGQTVTVREQALWVAWIFAFPAKLIFLFQQLEFYQHIVSFILMLLILYLGINYGMGHFRWERWVVSVVIIISLSLFWIFIYLLKDSDWYKHFVIPLIISTTGVLIPLLISFVQSRHRQYGYTQHIENELLKSLLIFSHGEYAQSNINSLYLLCINMPTTDPPPERLVRQFQERKNTFLKLVLPQIDKILKYCQEIRVDREQIQELAHLRNPLKHQLAEFSRTLSHSSVQGCQQLGGEFAQLRNLIRDLRNDVFRDFTAEVTQVILNVSATLEEELGRRNIRLVRKKEEEKPYYGLIPAHELGDVLNNCLKNAIHAIKKGRGSGHIVLDLYRHAPKIRLDIIDNGCGIPADDQPSIFESGFSATRGTGQGLFMNRKILNRYGGRISLVTSEPDKGTTFRIELLEGVKP